MRALPESAMNNEPHASNASPRGLFIVALRANASSPEEVVYVLVTTPVPTTVVMIFVMISTRRMRFAVESEMYRLPDESIAAPNGVINVASVANPPSPLVILELPQIPANVLMVEFLINRTTLASTI